jgi:hypothetical protein
MYRAALLLGIVGVFSVLAVVARWIAGAMGWDFKLTYLAVLVLTSGMTSVAIALQRRRLRSQLQQLPAHVVEALAAESEDIKYAFPAARSRSSFLTVSIGITCVSFPTLPLLVGPIFVLQTWLTVEPPLPQFAALGLGFALAWAWWSIAATQWRQWAQSGGMTAAEVQYHGERASILWPRGSFFEKTELGNILARYRNDA